MINLYKKESSMAELIQKLDRLQGKVQQLESERRGF